MYNYLFEAIFIGNKNILLIVEPTSKRIIEANDAASSFYGWPREQLRKMKVTDINVATPAEINCLCEEVSAQLGYECIVKHRVNSGDVKTVEVKTTRIKLGGEPAIMACIRDITEEEQRAAEVLQDHAAAKEILRIQQNSVLRCLTPKEKDTLRLIGGGCNNKDIAIMLNVSTCTVEAHRAKLRSKLKAKNTAQLILWAEAAKYNY